MKYILFNNNNNNNNNKNKKSNKNNKNISIGIVDFWNSCFVKLMSLLPEHCNYYYHIIVTLLSFCVSSQQCIYTVIQKHW